MDKPAAAVEHFVLFVHKYMWCGTQVNDSVLHHWTAGERQCNYKPRRPGEQELSDMRSRLKQRPDTITVVSVSMNDDGKLVKKHSAGAKGCRMTSTGVIKHTVTLDETGHMIYEE